MCRLVEPTSDACPPCKSLGHRKCNHEIAVCSNPAVHPRWQSYYIKNYEGTTTFRGCGFCRYAEKAALTSPATTLADNPGWPGCCFPPMEGVYHWVPPEDWPLVAAFHRMAIPQSVQIALDNLKAERRSKQNRKAAAASQHLTIQPPSRMTQQPVPIPKSANSSGSSTYIGARSYSPSAIHISQHEGSTSPRSSTSSGSNSSGSPPSSTAGSRRGTIESDGSPVLVRSGSSGSQDDPRMMIRSSSRQSARKDGSPMGRIARGEVAINGKRRSNSDPKHQQAPPPPPSAYQSQPREKGGRESPTQTRYRSSSSGSSNHPYSNPNSAASSSMKKLSQLDQPSQPTPIPPVPAATTSPSVVGSLAGAPSRIPTAPTVPRSRQSNGAPSITSVMADMSNMSLNQGNPYGSNHPALARLQMENPNKRGVIPPHVRKAGSVISASSTSSSSTNSSAREGTVISDGFTDYVSDDSELELQRRAERDAEIAYQEALRKHEEMEFKEARESLVRTQNFPDPYRRGPPMMSSSRIRV